MSGRIPPPETCPLCSNQRQSCTCRPDDVLGPEPYRSAKPLLTVNDMKGRIERDDIRIAALEAEIAAIVEVIGRVEDPVIGRAGRSVHDWLAQILQTLVMERDSNAVALVKIRLALAQIPWDVMKTAGPPYVITFTPNAFNGMVRIIELLDDGIQQAIDTLDPNEIQGEGTK